VLDTEGERKARWEGARPRRTRCGTARKCNAASGPCSRPNVAPIP